MDKYTYRLTLGMAMAALAALPWAASAQSEVGVGAGVGANVNAGVAGGTTSGNVTTGVRAEDATSLNGPRGALQMPTDPNRVRNERSSMDGHVGASTNVGVSGSDDFGVLAPAKKTGTVRKHGPYRGSHGTVRTNATTHGTVKVK